MTKSHEHSNFKCIYVHIQTATSRGQLKFCIEMGIDGDIINCKYFGSFIIHILEIELLRNDIK